MTQDELQRAYNAALIKSWRKHLQLRDVNDLYFETSVGFPWKGTVRVFVSSYLNKISVKMWDQPIEKDAVMLAKLATSKSPTGKELANTKSQLKRNTL